MKLNVDFDALERVAGKFSSTRAFDLNAHDDQPWEDIDVRLQHGVEVDLADLEVVDGLLSYQGRHVILYIRDHGRNVVEALRDPSKGRKYHLADCETLEWMRSENRFQRYYAAQNTSGTFEISGMDPISREQVTGNADLQVCMNCLKRLNYQSFLLQGSSSRRSIRVSFALVEFFETYSTRFRELPSGFSESKDSAFYTSDWQEVSRSTREQVNFSCQDCGVCLGEHRALLHVHHINGVKGDNRKENLRALCKDCHRKQPQHGHIFLKAKEMAVIYRLRREQGLVTRNWDNALKLVDTAIRPVLELARHKGWEAPDVGLPVQAQATDHSHLDAAWPGSKRAVSCSVKPGKHGQWSVEEPGRMLDELADGLR